MQGSKGDTDVNNVLLDSVGEGEGGMIWEDSIETCILLYIKQMISACTKFDAWSKAPKASALGQLRGMGWGGRWQGGSGWGNTMYPRLIHVDVWQKPSQYCKVIILQLKLIFKKWNVREMKLNKKEQSILSIEILWNKLQ